MERNTRGPLRILALVVLVVLALVYIPRVLHDRQADNLDLEIQALETEIHVQAIVNPDVAQILRCERALLEARRAALRR